MEENKSVYALKKVNEPQAFCAEIKNLKGVLDAKVDEENMTLEYRIDDWTSDYDVFTQIMTIADAYGCEFDFDHGDGKANDDLTGAEETTSETAPELPEEEDRKTLSERVQRIIELSVALVFSSRACFLKIPCS